MEKYIYQYPNWPKFTWDDSKINPLLNDIRYLQGKMLGRMELLGFSVIQETMLSTLTLDVLKSSEIEGELLNYDQVRSSIAKRLGIDFAGMLHVDRHVEGVVEMMMDATGKYQSPLTHERLHSWHASLFPTGWSGLQRIQTGMYRSGEMQIVSGPMGRETVHYEAPAPEGIYAQMSEFLQWFNNENALDGVLKSAIAHFWFIIIHPFDDGNGRIARALSDLLLARSENTSKRFYSLSNQILTDKKNYYRTLQRVQYSDGDITEWILWFLKSLKQAIEISEVSINNVIVKASFWDKHAETELNSRQRIMINKLLDGFDGKLKTSKWAKITKCSSDTALRDIKNLLEKDILRQEESGGRSTSYALK